MVFSVPFQTESETEEHLDSIFDKALTTETLDEIGLQNHNS
jgi:hypothetical protein